MSRLSKNEYAMWFAVLASKRSTCDRLRVGCAIFDAQGHVLSTGYNGSAPGQPHCDEHGHYIVGGSCRRTIHAEQNAVGHAARIGVSLSGSVAFVTNHPCIECAKLLASSGVSHVIYLNEYRQEYDETAELLSNITFMKYAGDRPWEK